MKRHLATIGAALLLAACSEPGATGNDPSAALRRDLPAPGARGATFMTRNIYVGGRLEIITGVTDPSQLPAAIAQVLGEIQYTDFYTRAKAIADEIARNRPAVIGLQELSHIYYEGNELYDYLAILQSELEARGLHYTALENITSDVTLGPAQLVDGDALLIAEGLPYDNVAQADFDSLLDLFGVMKVVRGWVGADVTIGGVTYRVINTHLESNAPTVSSVQAQELLDILGGESKPTVLLGDFNSGPGTDLSAYDVLVGAGFVDTWVDKNRGKSDWTCCQDEILSTPTSLLDQRIDFVLVRDRFQNWRAGVTGGVQTAIVGNNPADRILAPAVPPLGLPERLLWPSDHAGYLVTLRMPPAP